MSDDQRDGTGAAVVAGVILVLVIVLVGGGLYLFRGARAARERAVVAEIALRAAVEHGAIENRIASGSVTREVDLAKLLEQTSVELAHADLEPEREASVREKLAQIYTELGFSDRAHDELQRASDLHRSARENAPR